MTIYEVRAIYDSDPLGGYGKASPVGLYATEELAVAAVKKYLAETWNRTFPKQPDGERGILSAMKGGETIIRPQRWDVPATFVIRTVVVSD